MPPLKKINRREFLATSASAASLMIVPSGAFAVSKTSPQNKLNVAFIGMGGQIQGHVQNILRQEHNVTVMCDVDENQLAKAKDRYGEYLEKTNFYTDYRKLFEKEKSIDAVVIATPDHWHAPICKMAIEAGKHVYCEKPLAHTVSEARMLRELSRESKVVTQMGNQGSASSGIRRSIELIQADVFGDISRIHVWHPEHNWPSGESRPDGADAVPEGFQWDFSGISGVDRLHYAPTKKEFTILKNGVDGMILETGRWVIFVVTASTYPCVHLSWIIQPG